MLKNTLVILAISIGSIITSSNLYAQAKVSLIGNYLTYPNTDIDIPILGENLNDITSFTLSINIDTNQIIYKNIAYLNSSFQGGLFLDNFNETTQNISLSWSSSPNHSVNMLRDTICLMTFHVKEADTVSLHFNDNCELSNSSLQTIDNVIYTNGTIYVDSSFVFNVDPLDQEIDIQSQSTISILDQIMNVDHYSWQIKDANSWIFLQDNFNFDNVNSSQLHIFAHDTFLNGSIFRCKLSCNQQDYFSKESFLNVINNDGIVDRNTNFQKGVKIQRIGSNAMVIVPMNDYENFSVDMFDINGKILLNQFFIKVDKEEELYFSLNQFNENNIYIINCSSNNQLLLTEKFKLDN